VAPEPLRGWLTWPGSLTRALHDRFGDAPHIDVVQSGATPALVDEAVALGLRAGQCVHAREVRIAAAGRLRISARSVACLGPGNAALTLLRGLGGTSLGNVLFAASHPPLALGRRGAASRRWTRFAAPVTALGETDWSRRSLWIVGGSPLLVTEVFHLRESPPGR
jgi:chorismate lyase